jgi:hypothetical protein
VSQLILIQILPFLLERMSWILSDCIWF